MNHLEKLMKEMQFTTFEVGSSCWVDVTHINNPLDFYVRPRAYKMFLNAVQARGVQNNSNIELGSIMIYKSRTRKTYIRGRVLSIEHSNPPRFCFFALDYGFLEADISQRRVWGQCDQGFVPPLVTQCGLADCVPFSGNEFHENATLAMKTFIDGERARMIIRSNRGGHLMVELYNSGPDDIATMLTYTAFSRFAYVPPDVHRNSTYVDPRAEENAAGPSSRNAGDTANTDGAGTSSSNAEDSANTDSTGTSSSNAGDTANTDGAGTSSSNAGDSANTDGTGTSSSNARDTANTDGTGTSSSNPGDTANTDGTGTSSSKPGDTANTDGTGTSSSKAGDTANTDGAGTYSKNSGDTVNMEGAGTSSRNAGDSANMERAGTSSRYTGDTANMYSGGTYSKNAGDTANTAASGTTTKNAGGSTNKNAGGTSDKSAGSW